MSNNREKEEEQRKVFLICHVTQTYIIRVSNPKSPDGFFILFYFSKPIQGFSPNHTKFPKISVWTHEGIVKTFLLVNA
jgi:hypothetical protein